MPNKSFLETQSLYSKFSLEIHAQHAIFNSLPKPAINFPCKLCKSSQTFNMINEYHENLGTNGSRLYIWENTVRAQYLCSACRGYHLYFFLHFYQEKDDAEKGKNIGKVIKVGQYPAWDISMDANLEKNVG